MNNDPQIQRSVQEELSREPSVTAAHIGVAARDGVVTLSGHVTSYAEKDAAEKAACRTEGVRAVAEELHVELPFDMKLSDEEIGAAAIYRLSWDTTVPTGAVKVNVEQGWLTLTGQVEWGSQKDEVQNALRPLPGVVGVFDRITVMPRPDAVAITADIERALHRSSVFHQDNVSVTAAGGSIRLNGTVPTFDDKCLAANTARHAPGVTSVVNEISVW